MDGGTIFGFFLDIVDESKRIILLSFEKNYRTSNLPPNLGKLCFGAAVEIIILLVPIREDTYPEPAVYT